MKFKRLLSLFLCMVLLLSNLPMVSFAAETECEHLEHLWYGFCSNCYTEVGHNYTENDYRCECGAVRVFYDNSVTGWKRVSLDYKHEDGIPGTGADGTRCEDDSERFYFDIPSNTNSLVFKFVDYGAEVYQEFTVGPFDLEPGETYTHAHDFSKGDCSCGAVNASGNSHTHNFVTDVCDCGAVKISAITFPDEIFRNCVAAYDSDKDGILSTEELSQEIRLYLSNMGISNLTGIEYFTALTYLDCDHNQLTNLDVSKCTAMESLYCYGNERTITVEQKQFDLNKLNAGGFDITKASNWVGGTVDGNILTVTAAMVTYTYDVGNGKTYTFTLSSDCAHNWQGSICTVCELECAHRYMNGICTVCGFECAHAEHTWHGFCNECTKNVGHNYVNDLCVCGSCIIYFDNSLTDWENPFVWYVGDVVPWHGTEGEDNIWSFTVKDGERFTFKTSGVVNGQYVMYEYTVGPFDVVPGKTYTHEAHDFSNGACSCGAEKPAEPECEHSAHNAYGVCNACDVTVGHKYSNNVCDCGCVRVYFNSTGTDWEWVRAEYTDENGAREQVAFGNDEGNNLWSYDIPANSTNIVFAFINENNVKFSVGSYNLEAGRTYTKDDPDECEHKVHDRVGNCVACYKYVGHNDFTDDVCSCGNYVLVYFDNSVTDWEWLSVQFDIDWANGTEMDGDIWAFAVPKDTSKLYFRGYLPVDKPWGYEMYSVGPFDLEVGKTYTHSTHNYIDGVCSCGANKCASGHSWENDSCSTCGAVKISEITFPDANFRTIVAGYDSDKDGLLTGAERNNVTDLFIANRGIKDLSGIQYFANLKTLICNSNELTSLDVSKNTALGCLECDDNQLTSLNVSGCTVLATLRCDNNKLTSLDLSSCTKLENLFCENNQLTSLDLSKVERLIWCRVSGNTRTISAAQNKFDLSKLAGFDVSKASKWEGGVVSGNILTVAGDEVTYTYDFGNEKSEIFTLVISNYCDHKWQNATCEAPKTCSVCGATEGNAKGHKWTDATCTAPRTCSVCGETEGTANGHKWTEATCTAPKTCSVCNATEGNAKGHKWTDATCTAPKTCSVCKVTEGEAKGHKWTDATCTAPKTCSVCKATEGEALGHKWTEATCTAPKTCSVCKATEGTVKVHNWVDATCTTPKTCADCKITQGEALGHSWTNATCTTPKTCAVCKVTDGNAKGHIFDQEKVDPKYLVSEATTTEQAVYKRSCKCGEAGTETFKYGDLKPTEPDVNDDIKSELDDLITSDAAPEEIREAVQNIDIVDLKKAMEADKGNFGVVSALAQLEEAFGGHADVVVSEEAAAFDASQITIIGAKLNNAASDSEPITLLVDKSKEEHVLPTLFNSNVAVSFSMDLDNVKDSENLDVPVKIILPIPATINPECLVILHYQADGSYEEVNPYIFNEGLYYAEIVLTHFSDFVMTEYVDDPVEPGEFKDVPKDAFYYAPVMWAVQNKVTSGTGDGTTFSPNEICTRGQVVTFLWRAAGQPEPTRTENPFTDVKVSDFFYKAVLWAVEKGITTGTGDGTTFEPGANCNRGQIVTFLSRAKDGKATTSKNPFVDVAESAFYYNPVLWAVENEITTGTGDGTTFAPNEDCTRGQVITFLYRAYK